MEVYPSQYPCPRLRPYSYVVDMGVLRTPMDGGYSRQRRLYDVMPHRVSLEFVLPMSALYGWQSWVNRYAYEYFAIPLSTLYASEKDEDATLTVARFTSELRVELADKGYVKIAVEAELAPSQDMTTAPGNNWIIGGTPAAPAYEWVRAGTPASPSTDIINAGSAISPSRN